MVLEFLGLKNEYSESALEDALIHRLEQFLLELGNDSRLSLGRTVSGSETSGIAWTSAFFTAVCDV
jgi:YhcG PDDEXK nuclease domain